MWAKAPKGPCGANNICHSKNSRKNYKLDSEKLKKAVAVSEEKSSSVPEGGADFPAAICLAGKCPNLGGDSIVFLTRNPLKKAFFP